ERLLQMDASEFVATMRRWRQFFLDGADMPVIGVDSATLRTIQLPTCIIPGHDLIHPRHVGEALAGILPNSELHYLEPPARPASQAARQQARLDHQRSLADIFLDFLSRRDNTT